MLSPAQKSARQASRVEHGICDDGIAGREVKEVIASFEIVGVKFQRVAIMLGGTSCLTAATQKIAETNVQECVARVLLDQAPQMLFTKGRCLNGCAVEQPYLSKRNAL